MADESLTDYFARYGINLSNERYAGSNGLALAVTDAQQSIVDKAAAARASAPELVATGAITASPRGSYWIVPTADGVRYVKPVTDEAPRNVESSSFTDSLAAGQREWAKPAGPGWYIADGEGGQQMRFGGSLPGMTDGWVQNETSYMVFDKAPTERFFVPTPDSKSLLGDGPMGWAIPLIVNYFVPGAGAALSGGVTDVAAGGFTGDIAADALASGTFASPAAAAAAAPMSFGDALTKALDPERMLTRAGQNIVTQAVTRGDISPSGVVAGAVGGIAGDTVKGIVGNGLVGTLAGTAVGAGVSTATSGLINSDPTNQRLPIQVPGATGQSNGPNAVPSSFALTLSPFRPQFNRNTAS